MKKVLIALLVLIAAYAIGAVVLAVANGQAEGKVVSEQKQLLVDGDMEASGVGSWDQYHATASKVAGAAIDGTQILHIAYAGNAVGSAYQGGFTVGKTYRMTGWARGDGTSVPEVRTNTGTLWSGTTSTEWQQIDTVFVYAGNGNFQIGSSNFQSVTYVEFDDVFLTEYTGDMTNADQQILTDGDMEKSGTSDWGNANCTLAKLPGGATDGERIMELTGTGSIPRAYQNVITIGKTYRVTGWAKSGDGVNRPAVDIGLGQAASNSAWYGTTSQNWQRVDVVATALNTTYVYLKASESSGTVYFDNILVTEYTGDMTNADQQVLVDGDMEKSGTANWTSVQGAVLSKEVGGPGDGDRVLRLTSSSVADPGAYQSNISVGSRYRMTGWARTDSSREVHFGDRLDIDGCAAVTVGTDWTFIDCTFTAIYAASRVGFSSSATDQWVEYDNVLITEI